MYTMGNDRNGGFRMPRVTSRIAYRQINEDGTAMSQKQTILDEINSIPERHRNFGITLRELTRSTGYDINAVSGRVNDLKKNGNVEECDKRKCRITGRLVTPVTFTYLV